MHLVTGALICRTHSDRGRGGRPIMTLFVATTSVASQLGAAVELTHPPSPPVCVSRESWPGRWGCKINYATHECRPALSSPNKRRDLATAPRTGPFLTAPPPGPARIRPHIISDSGFSRRLRETLVCSTKLNWNGLQRVVIRKHSLVGNKQEDAKAE